MPAELRSGSLIARDRELMIARAALERARAGSGGVLAFTGEAGIGKSRLLDSLINVAGRHGWLVLT
ncbi:MAG: AAA family ATPase, partial [Actinomycetes bacterium]